MFGRHSFYGDVVMEMSFESLILKPLLEMLFRVLYWLLQLFQLFGQSFFTIEIVENILLLFQSLMYGIFVIGVLLALIDYVVLYLDGSVSSFFSVGKNIGKALIITLCIQKLMLLAYESILFLSRRFLHFEIKGESLFSLEKLATLFQFQVADTLIGIFLVLTFIFIFAKILLQIIARNGLFLCFQCTVIFYIIGICRGRENVFSSWLIFGLSLCFTHFVQILFLSVALVYFTDAKMLILSCSLLLAAMQIEKILEYVHIIENRKISKYRFIQNTSSALQKSI